MEQRAEQIWLEIKEQLKQELEQDVFESYFEPIKSIYKENGNLIYLTVDSVFVKTRIQNNYLYRMNVLLRNYYSDPHFFMLLSKDEITEIKKDTTIKTDFTKVTASGLNPNYTFSTFVVGDSNRFAHRYATMVADQLAGVANPVYIFGDVGLGKTHLMHAIGNYILESKPDYKILYEKTENFVEDYVKASKNNGYDEFSEKFKDIDVLLVDDIQFLSGKTQCQLEFFKIFERLTSDKKLIVLTSDRKPSELKDIMTRLTSRFEWGISLDINKPDKEHRINILNSKLKQEIPNPEAVPPIVIDYIATVCESNIRQLEGDLKRVLFYCDAFDLDYSLESAKEALKGVVDLQENIESSIVPSQEIKKTLDVVSSYFKITQDDLLGESRKKEIIYARKLCWYILRTRYDLTFQKIGNIFNGKDHSTVMHGYQTFEADFEINQDTKRNVENILRKMGKNPNQI